MSNLTHPSLPEFEYYRPETIDPTDDSLQDIFCFINLISDDAFKNPLL
jgi:hypothetical protein